METVPESFQSVEQYLASYTFPLLEETRASLCSSMQDVSKLPFAKVTGFVKGKKNAYHAEVDYWRNRSSDRGKEPYKTLPGDVLMLTNAKPDTIPSLERFAGRWAFASVAEIAGDAEGNAQTPTKFRVEAFLDNEVNDDRTWESMYAVFLINAVTNNRIWKNTKCAGTVHRADAPKGLTRGYCSSTGNFLIPAVPGDCLTRSSVTKLPVHSSFTLLKDLRPCSAL